MARWELLEVTLGPVGAARAGRMVPATYGCLAARDLIPPASRPDYSTTSGSLLLAVSMLRVSPIKGNGPGKAVRTPSTNPGSTARWALLRQLTFLAAVGLLQLLVMRRELCGYLEDKVMAPRIISAC